MFLEKTSLKDTSWKYTLSREFKEEDTVSPIEEQWRKNGLCRRPSRTKKAVHDTITRW